MRKIKRLKLRMVEIKELIGALMELYDLGADFVDIEAKKGEGGDVMDITVRDEYFRITDEFLNSLM